MKQRDIIVVNGGLMSENSCKKAMCSLNVIERTLSSLINPGSDLSPKERAWSFWVYMLLGLIILPYLLLWFFAAQEYRAIGAVIAAGIAMCFFPSAKRDIKNTPETHEEVLINELKIYSPCSRNGYDEIINSINNDQTINLMQVRNWLKHERKAFEKLLEKQHQHLLYCDED